MYTLSSLADVAMGELDVNYIRIKEDGFKITIHLKKKDYRRLTEWDKTTFEYKCRPVGVYFTYEEESRWNVLTNTAFGICLTNAVRTVKNGLMKLLRMN